MGWYPNAVKMPGRNAGYRVGRASMVSAVCHYTVGVNSAGIGVQGYFNTLIRRNGEVVVFAEDDAICWHAGNWNSRGPGIEIEYYEPKDGPPPENIFTDAALASCGRYVRYLNNEYGTPLDFYDGARISSHNGFITHRSLIQTGDRHHDWWSQADWDAMVGSAPSKPVLGQKKKGFQDMFIMLNEDHQGDPKPSALTTPVSCLPIDPGLAFQLVATGMPVAKVSGKVLADTAKAINANYIGDKEG